MTSPDPGPGPGREAATPHEPLLEAQDAGRRYHSRSGAPVEALGSVSLSIPRGAWVAVTGPSGGGKTTLLGLLAALDRPTTGRIRFDGEDLRDASDARLARIRRRMGLVFQDAPMLRRLSAWENVACPLVPRAVPGRERRARALAALEGVGLADRADARPEELSAGELQRVGVARALITSPDVVIADEPTSHLDRDTATSIASVLRSAHAQGLTVVVATHDPLLVAGASRVLLLAKGKLEAPRPGT